MGPFLHGFLPKCLLVVFLIFPAYFLTQCVSSMQPPCWDSERSALLQLKESFILNKDASLNEGAYPKVRSWKVKEQGGFDCCSWHGVECDDNTGHVIGLDLSSSFLYGSIDSNSSLFHLFHLTRLNLSDNNFKGSKIPSTVGNLSRLSLLDLSLSGFSGQIPTEVLELSKLEALDLSDNSLELRNPSLKSLAENLVNLKYLSLVEVKISSTIPQSLANLSSLTYLSLARCDLHGEFPVKVFQLPNLQILRVSNNPYLRGSLPEFPKNSSIESLMLFNTSFAGGLPKSIGNLNSLGRLDVGGCNFSGLIPSSMANLTHLTFLSLCGNRFGSSTLSWLGKQTKLTELYLYSTNSSGSIPSSLKNITQLTTLDLYGNQLTGQIPSWIGNFSQLTTLVLSRNDFYGPIPQSIFTLVHLETLYLHENHLSGTVKLESLTNLPNLFNLDLSYNNLSLLTTATMNVTLPKFKVLGLASCNLSKFPDFLRGQNVLEDLALDQNKIGGCIPTWIWGLSMGSDNLKYLSLFENLLTCVDKSPVIPLWTNLIVLELSFNKLQGSLPIPPPSINRYSVSNNLLTGEISPTICSLGSITVLDISSNNFSGKLPPCLGNLSKSLSVLNLQSNNFHGPIPEICGNGSKLKMIDLSQNQLDGHIPRSMVYCSMLESLNLRNNKIEDTFPSQLGKLPELKMLILGHNRFHGAIGKPDTNYDFPYLRILDLSSNKFVGELPSQYFPRWKAMKVVDSSELKYLQVDTSFEISGYISIFEAFCGMTMTNKGVEIKYEKIQDFLVVIDLSSNQFVGTLEDIQILKGLQLLNLSNNFLSGPIPPSLANLTNLESLDLSQNKLSGEIPQELAQLTFLAFLNVSHNQLLGPIPQGKQFATFENSSFEDNPRLCGNPLSKKCYVEASQPQPWSSKKDESGGSLVEFGWKIVVLGYGSGVVLGLILGYAFNPWKHKWFVKYFGGNKQQRRRRRS